MRVLWDRLRSTPFDLGGGFVVLFAALQALIIAAQLAPGASNVTLVALCLWMFAGPLQCVQALSFFVLVKYLSPTIFPTEGISPILIAVVPVLAGLRFIPTVRLRDLRATGPIAMMGLVAAICSAFTSQALDVSLFKSAMFVWVAGGLAVAVSRLTEVELGALLAWLRSLAFVVSVLSLIAWVIAPGLTYHNESGLFRGVLSHPQALGVYIAPWVASLLVATFISGRRQSWIGLTTLAAAGATLLLTRSRTATAAVVIGIVITLFAGRRGGQEAVGSGSRARALIMLGLVVVGLVWIELGRGGLLDSASQFVLKRGDASMAEAVAAARGDGAMAQFGNFLRSPVVGNGFGVYADGRFNIPVVRLGGIPISAPVEKGFLPTAVLEETGAIGALAFCALVFSLCASVWRRAPAEVVVVLLVSLLVNVGEAILFSPTGMGLQMWLLLVVTSALGRISGELSDRPGAAIPPKRQPNPQVLR